MKVTAVLVCHNGARWLPQVLSALRAGERAPDRIVAVDTGSEDGSVDLVREALRVEPVRLDADAGFPAAVAAALATLPVERAPEDASGAASAEWIWLLHDDSAPHHRCLAALADTAAAAPEQVVALGPKLREWPSLRRLLEVGVSLSGTGRRETGLETGEYDQGQHDEVRRVLAVNTAGMLIRRDVLAEAGLAEELPVFGCDLDLGWRLARRGLEVQVHPEAVAFHAEAARRGRRRAALTARPRRDERAAALFTLLANGSRPAHPFRVLRLLVGSLLRALGLLLVRAPAEARAEVAAVARVYGHPLVLHRARRARLRAARVPAREVRPLLPPWWMPWRHVLDFVVEVARAGVHVLRDRLARRPDQRPWPARVATSPTTWLLLALTVVALVAGRGLLHGPPLRGGALLPAPDGVGHWWALWAQSWHWLGSGTAVPAPPYLLPFAVAGTVLFAEPGLLVWLLFCLGVPLAAIGALRFLRRLCSPSGDGAGRGSGPWAPLWGAAAYALVPVVSGAVAQGRLGTVTAAVLLPWLGTALLGLAADDEERRRRALWRSAALLAVLVALVPYAWVPAAVLLVLATPLGVRRGRGRLVALLLAPLLLAAPWWPALVASPAAALVEAGRAAVVLGTPDRWHLLVASAGGPGAAPWWLSVGLPVAALVALIRRDTRVPVARLWVVALAGAVTAWLLTRASITLPGIAERFGPWPGFALLLTAGAWIAAATVAADGAVDAVGRRSFGWRQPIAAVAMLLALAAPLAGAGWWLVGGADGPLHRAERSQVPTYMSDVAEARRDSATLVLTGGPGTGADRTVEYRVVRQAVPRIGDDGVLALTAPDPAVRAAVERLIGGDEAAVADALAAHGIAYAFAPAPVSPSVAGAFDAAEGFATASAPGPRARAWRLVTTPTTTAIQDRGAPGHPWLLAVQVLTVVTLVVLCVPGRRQS